MKEKRNMNSPSMMSLASLALALAVAGCGANDTANPEPAAAAEPVSEMEDATRTSVSGVSVLTQAAPWPGETPIENEVTPIRVRIENNGRIPIDVRYRDLTLLGPEGNRYNALPPYRIAGTVTQPEVDRSYGPINNPGFTHSGFELAPYYSPVYPGMAVYTDPFVYDANFYGNAYRYWEDTQLPTVEMLRQAMPEGVVNSGGNIEGWVYFEKVPEHERRVVLRTDLVDSRTGKEFAEVRIPYNVD